ncbi:hydrogen peroxide-inducible genes activator [Aestuariicella hydrocarbonica]|uniref:Hydrogen peroxide-inducible genes activator n=1 Tax=Pseudomaricurvus hydrocarbonicus TaxID=1470433 RepID=A0A9E5MQ44_9GAMM|nr:hydrogen peroxide-inducible genes activator [Aestuariicella hydrocarbonica]NHO68360.1 hydrogen peroxide-inducible genes activator [Aestuariicella hydrocarbonica]
MLNYTSLATTKLPTLRQLQYFVAVADIKHFRNAADELGVSQPGLTTQIAALEETLQVPLFERSRSGTRLSPEGRELLASARDVLLSMQGFLDQTAVIAGGQQITYKLGVPPTLGPYLLPNVLPDLHKRFQQLKFYVREAPPRNLQRGLLEGEYDLAILPLPQTSMELAVEPLFMEPLKFVISSDHPLAGQDKISPQQLRGERVLTLEEHHHFHHEVLEICLRLGAEIHRDYEGTSLDTLRQMVVMGLGVAFLPGLYVHSELHDPEALHVAEIRGQRITRGHGLVWRATAPGRQHYRELAAQLKQIVRERMGPVVEVID